MAEESSNEQFINPSRRSYVYESSRSSGNRTRIIMIIVGLIILVALVAFAIIATGGQGDQEIVSDTTEEVTTPSPTEAQESEKEEVEEADTTPTSTPTPTKASTSSSSGLDREDLSIVVQNGSGVAGAATKASDFLKGLGYDISSTGNADNFDYTATIIRVKSTKEEYLDQLEEDLSDEYTIESATADYEGTADAIVIVGSE